ncbi:hypothetical protein VNO78_23535 [Psophocarpus tetragonolobus]|uniref:Uncharacterized protein n=1 Tax=Psophocarpus tetragonolobus TaxID=3891 RepID=A0AAN9XDM7_PSOTE
MISWRHFCVQLCMFQRLSHTEMSIDCVPPTTQGPQPCLVPEVEKDISPHQYLLLQKGKVFLKDAHGLALAVLLAKGQGVVVRSSVSKKISIQNNSYLPTRVVKCSSFLQILQWATTKVVPLRFLAIFDVEFFIFRMGLLVHAL